MQGEVHGLEKYLNTSKEKILKEVGLSRNLENNKYGRSKEEVHQEHRKKYEGKPLQGQFRKATFLCLIIEWEGGTSNGKFGGGGGEPFKFF